jgi:hypothetical protein
MLENKFIIRIFEEVGGDSAISVEDGDAIFRKIDNAISHDMLVTLDFQNIKLIITAFLNAAIGQLYSKYTSEQLNDKLNFENISPEDIRLFKKVLERAKEYFSNPDGFETIVNNSQ